LRNKLIIISIILFISITILVAAPLQEKMKALVVYGSGFVFGVTEPENWTGDTENAGRFQANIIFYPIGQAWSSPDVVIRVRINKKVDENTVEDLSFDMEGYRNRFPQIQFEDIEISHPKYRSFPKLFFVENNFYEYVTYVNPGEAYWYTFSVALTTQKKRAEKNVLEAYKEVVASLLAISGFSCGRNWGHSPI
jgi:hypothetical protein